MRIVFLFIALIITARAVDVMKIQRLYPTSKLNSVQLATAVSGGTATMVFRNGVLQDPGLDYAITSAGIITFIKGAEPRAGDRVVIVYWTAFDAGQKP